MQKKLVLIDGNSLINRAFFALPPLSGRDGTPMNAVYGFTTMLIRLIETTKPDYLCVCFDLKAPTFRHKMYDGYKANRKGMPDDLAVQLPRLKELLKVMGIHQMELAGYEADDIIGTLSKNFFDSENTQDENSVIIVTGDKDALQLIDNNITVYLTRKGISETESFDVAHFSEVYGLRPSKMIDIKALMGDSSDNIPGVAGIGEITALKLLHTYSDLSGVLSHIDEQKGALRTKLESGVDMARLSYELATINTQVPLDYKQADFDFNFPFSCGVRDKFEQYGFKSLLKRNDIFDGAMVRSATAVYVSDNPFGESSVSDDRVQKNFEYIKKIVTIEDFKDINFAVGYSLYIGKKEIHFACFETETEVFTEYVVKLNGEQMLLDGGVCLESVLQAVPLLNSSDVPKIVFDYKKLRHELALAKVKIANVWLDVQLAQYIIDCNVRNTWIEDILSTNDLDKILEYPACGMLILAKQFEAELNQPINTVPQKSTCKFADGMKFDSKKDLYDKIDFPLLDVLFEAEWVGMHIDVETLQDCGRQLSKREEQLEKEIFESIANDYGVADKCNLRSPKQLAELLFVKIGLKGGKKTKDKNFSTASDVLEGLVDEHPMVGKILELRHVSKLNSTYVESIKKLLDEDCNLHTEFKTCVTATGRLSSVDPNIQNIPIRDDDGKILRKMFVAREGCKFVSADYSQIELRLMAAFSQEPALIESFRNGEDIHLSTASQVFGVPKSEVTSAQRREAKAVNFGVIYGISEFGLSKNIGIPVAKAKLYIDGYFMRYPYVKEYLNSLLTLVRKTGEFVTVSGRSRKFNDINASNGNLRIATERTVMNHPLQSTAADLIKIAMNRIFARIKKEKLDSKILCQIHDELILECPIEEVERVEIILKEEMESAIVFDVPIVVDVSVGDNWYEL